MIESIEFSNFKVLRTTTLPLAPFTLLLGPNGSGKSTVLQSLRAIAEIAVKRHSELQWGSLVSLPGENRMIVQAKLRIRWKDDVVATTFIWQADGKQGHTEFNAESGRTLQADDVKLLMQWLGRMQTYSLDASAIAQSVPVNAGVTLQPNGAGLAAVLDDLHDTYPERWGALLAELCEWLPEYDNVLFDKPQQGQKQIALRTAKGKHRIPAVQLSQGTLLALALLTLAYVPDPPSLVGLEEIDRGLHPRLLRHLQDALYRLAHPEACGEKRAAIQVIATTHSPYLLDLYRDHPEEVVLAEKKGLDVEMRRLADIDHYTEIIGDSPLSEVWYSGILGGVSVQP